MKLKFYLLGAPYITWNGSVIEIPRRQVRKLLYYLATYPSAIPQERLHYLFWEDKPENMCRRNLSHLLTHARRVLPDKDILITTRSLVMLDYEQIWCDITEFSKLIGNAGEHDKKEMLQQAAKLYRGPYLDGVQLPGGREFEYLVERERFNFERKYLNLLYKLLLLSKREKDYESAIEYAFQYLAVDDLSEDVHRQIIILYGLTGKPERAIEQYKVCESLLKQELQTEVSKKTQAALQDILSERPLEAGSLNYQVSTNLRPARNSPTIISQEHLSQLDKLIHGNGYGPWGAVLIRGELGIGKTSLLRKYLKNFQNEHLVVYTKCDQGSNPIPYWPIRQACLAVSKSNSDLLARAPETLTKIEQCLSFSNSVMQANSENFSDILDKEYGFSALLEIINSLAEIRHGLVFCIEDLELADENTLDFILYLSNFLREKKILLIGSYCCDGEERMHRFSQRVQVARDFLGLVHLQGVDTNTTLALLKYWLGNFEGIEMFAEKLHQMSAGNPLFITEILQWIVESELPISDLIETDTTILPTSLSKVVDFRLSRLSTADRKVLDALAVQGGAFEVERLTLQTGLPALQILDALDNLVVYHLLVAESTTYQFRHEIIRKFILEAMSPARKKYLSQNNELDL